MTIIIISGDGRGSDLFNGVPRQSEGFRGTSMRFFSGAHRLNSLMRHLEVEAKKEDIEEVPRFLASALQVQILLLEMGDLPILYEDQN